MVAPQSFKELSAHPFLSAPQSPVGRGTSGLSHGFCSCRVKGSATHLISGQEPRPPPSVVEESVAEYLAVCVSSTDNHLVVAFWEMTLSPCYWAPAPAADTQLQHPPAPPALGCLPAASCYGSPRSSIWWGSLYLHAVGGGSLYLHAVATFGQAY